MSRKKHPKHPDDEILDLFQLSDHAPWSDLNPLADRNPFNSVFDDLLGTEHDDDHEHNDEHEVDESEEP